MASDTNALYIPIRGGDEEIEIPAEELPEDAGEIADILTEEKAPPEVWTKIAVAYHRQGKTEQFERVLKLTNATLSAETSTEAIVKRIDVLNSLAGFQLNQSKDVKADSRNAKADREEHLGQAVRYINEAATLAAENNDVDETNSAAGTWVVRGELQLLQGKETQAKSSFDNAAQVLEGYIPALLAKARMAFNEGDYKAALKHYCDTLRSKPDCPAEVRLGIALCYYRLQKPELAKKAFMRVLQMGPVDQPNVDALMGLAMLELNDTENDANEAIKVALTYAKTAYELGQVGQTNSKVLNYLADHFFFKKNFKYSEELAISGFHHSASEAIKAESCYSIARAYHVSKNYERAMQFYQEAVKRSKAGNYTKEGVGKDYVLPYFGLGQMFLWKKQYSEAIEMFEVVVKSHPDDYDTVKVLGWLYAKQGQTASGEWSEYTKRGIKFLRSVVEKRGDDVEVRLELAQLLETDSQRDNTVEAKDHYRAAMAVLKRRGIEIRPEIFNNLAVLYHRLGLLEHGARGRSKMFGRALKALTQGLSADEPGVTNAFPTFFEQDGADELTEAETAAGGLEPTVSISPNQMTAAYNLGLVYESLSRWGKAKMIFRSIVKLMPGYVDAWLRLAVLARDGGHVEKAKQYFMEAEKNSPKPTNGKAATAKAVDSIVLRGSMSLKLEKLGEAQEVFERVVKTLDPQDVYSHVALGNIYFTVAADAAKFKRGGEDTTSKERKYQEYAMMNYRRGFDLSKKRSIHAANGVGMVLLEQGFMSEAKTIFQRVRESTEDFPDGWTNLAHLYVAEKEYFQAIKLYEKCNKKFYGNADTGLLQFIARALFDWSRNWQDKGDLQMATQKMQECQQYCSRSLHIEPSNHVLWFNLAVAKLAGASCIIKQKEPSVEGVRTAMAELEQAKRLFSSLGESTATEKELGFKKAKAVENVNACDSRLNDAEAAFERAKGREDKMKTEDEKRIAAMEKMQAIQEEKAAAEKAERERIAARKAELVRVQKEKRQRVLDALANQQVEEQARKSATKKRKKGDEYEPENEDGGTLEDNDDEDAKRRKSDDDVPAPTNEDLFGTDSSDDEQESKDAKPQEPANGGKTAKADTKDDGDDDDDLELDDSEDDVPAQPSEAKGDGAQASAKPANANDDDLDLEDDDSTDKTPFAASNADASTAVPGEGQGQAEHEPSAGPNKKKARVMMESESDDE